MSNASMLGEGRHYYFNQSMASTQHTKIFCNFFCTKSLFTKFWSSAVRDQKSAKQCAKRIAPSKQRKRLGLCGAKGLGRWGAKAQHPRQHTHTLAHQCALRIPTLQHNSVTLHSIVQTAIPRPCIPTHTVGKHIALLHIAPCATHRAKGTCLVSCAAQSIVSLNRVRFYNPR